MKLVVSFLKLVRWPNLVFIVITQWLFYYCIILPSYQQFESTFPFLTWTFFVWSAISSVLIAAAGYIINDYFDLNIDQVNKPETIVVQRFIKRRWAIFWHITLSATGVIIAFYISWKIGNWWVGPVNLFCVVLLWVYSTSFKKKNLIGNIVISLLTAWVVLVLYVSELDVGRLQDHLYREVIKKIFKLAILYGGFAFIISLIREVVKDIEDMRGDEKYGCRTMPIVWGIPATKVFAGVWLVVLLLAIGVVHVYGIILGWYFAVAYGLFVIIIPIILVLRKLYLAVTVKEFHQISTYIKWIMLAGILSILFFKWHM
jgi:4-hydroxybenzoate polyprenyltransferase